MGGVAGRGREPISAAPGIPVSRDYACEPGAARRSGSRAAARGAGAGREVIVGIRPENFEDASLVSADLTGSGLTFPAIIDVLESLGSEKYVYFTRELGQTTNVAELQELARDSGRADVGGAAAETVVARLDPATRIGEGQEAQLWVDVRLLHVFDPASGRNLTLGDTGSPASVSDAGSAAGPAGAATSTDGGSAAPGQAASSAAPPPGRPELPLEFLDDLVVPFMGAHQPVPCALLFQVPCPRARIQQHPQASRGGAGIGGKILQAFGAVINAGEDVEFDRRHADLVHRVAPDHLQNLLRTAGKLTGFTNGGSCHGNPPSDIET